VDAVHAAATEAVADIRASGRPRFLELMTYRQRGHYEPDDQAYVNPEERAAWLTNDPIQRQIDRLTATGLLDDAGLAAMRERVASRVRDAVAFAQASPWPSPETLTDHVYA